MARRIEDLVVRGEIDNTVEGTTTGWLWLLGRSEPVQLELQGDCWRDLAGARLTFRNPSPGAGEGGDLAARQRGVVGDMTASRKAKVPVCRPEQFAARRAAGEEVPLVFKNILYLEWFSDSDGRVVIESADFELKLSEHGWRMDGDAEEAQKLANLQAMRDFLDRMIARRPSSDRDVGGDDEFAWEEHLQESDRLTDAYEEVLEKYMDDPDAERKEAFVMGWDGLLERMADEAEGKEPEMPEWKREIFEAAEEVIEQESWKDDDDDEDLFRPHPLQEEAQELALRAFDLAEREGDGCVDDGRLLAGELMKVAGKLAAALNGTYEREAGYVLAIINRCNGWIREASAACGRLADASSDPDRQRALEALGDEITLLLRRLTALADEFRGR